MYTAGIFTDVWEIIAQQQWQVYRRDQGTLEVLEQREHLGFVEN